MNFSNEGIFAIKSVQKGNKTSLPHMARGLTTALDELLGGHNHFHSVLLPTVVGGRVTMALGRPWLLDNSEGQWSQPLALLCSFPQQNPPERRQGWAEENFPQCLADVKGIHLCSYREKAVAAQTASRNGAVGSRVL